MFTLIPKYDSRFITIYTNKCEIPLVAIITYAHIKKYANYSKKYINVNKFREKIYVVERPMLKTLMASFIRVCHTLFFFLRFATGYEQLFTIACLGHTPSEKMG